MLFIYIFAISMQELPVYLKTNQIFIHPSSMKTKNTPKGCFEYNFTGVQFQVYGTYDKHYSIYLDDKFHATVNYVPANTSEPQYTSEYLPFGRHTIKLLSSDEAFEISQVSYLPSSNIRRIDFEAFEASGTWRDWTPTGTSNHVKYTATNGEYIRIQIRCSKFWVYGIEDPYHGDVSVKFNDFEATFSEEADTNYEYHVVYESPDLPLTDGTLTLTNSNSGSRSTSIAYVLILAEQFPCPASDPVPVSSGALKIEHIENVIETDEFDCEHFDNPCGLFMEPKDTSLPCSIEYTFTGVRFQVFGTFAPSHGKYRVYLDGVELATISQEYITRQDFALQYTSDIFVYGQHTIRIAADAGQQFKIYKLTYTISLNAKLISIDEFKGGYKVSNVLGGFYYFKESGEVFRSTVSCSKFWIVGDRYNDFKNLYVSYGENYPKKSFYQGGAGSKLFTILAESPELPLGSNELFISSEGSMIYHGIYIIDEPEIKAEPVSVSILRFDTLNSEHLCSDITTCPESEVALTACGQKCRTTGEATVTYDCKFIGVKFQIFGAIGSDLQTFDIHLDGKFYARFDERIGKQQSYAHLYTSELLEYGEHTIILQSDKVFEIYKLTYWVSMFAKRINATDFQLSDGMIKESDFTGGIEIHSTKPIYLKRHLCTSKFWIIGMGYYVPIIIKSGKFEATPTVVADYFCYMIYESPELSFYIDELTIRAESDRLYFNCLYYIDNCHPPTEVFSKSKLFSLSTQFSSSMIFSQTNEFSSTGLFSDTKKFSESDFFSQTAIFEGSLSVIEISNSKQGEYSCEESSLYQIETKTEIGESSFNSVFAETQNYESSETIIYSEKSGLSQIETKSEESYETITKFIESSEYDIQTEISNEFGTNSEELSGTIMHSNEITESESKTEISNEFGEQSDYFNKSESEKQTEISIETEYLSNELSKTTVYLDESDKTETQNEESSENKMWSEVWNEESRETTNEIENSSENRAHSDESSENEIHIDGSSDIKISRYESSEALFETETEKEIDISKLTYYSEEYIGKESITYSSTQMNSNIEHSEPKTTSKFLASPSKGQFWISEPTNEPKKKISKETLTGIICAVIIVILIAVTVVSFVIILRKRKNQDSKDEISQETKNSRISTPDQLEASTILKNQESDDIDINFWI